MRLRGDPDLRLRPMTREQKLAYHLEMIIWHDLPEGKRLNAVEIEHLMADATDDQRHRAYLRALKYSPLLLDDERNTSN